MLDVRRLRVLREVAIHGSFSAAADALAYTQSAVSQNIAALERETGTKLVDRGSRGVRLTQGGEALVRHTEAVLQRLAEAEAELEAIAGLRTGRVRLGTFPSAGASIVPPAIAAFRDRHPAVDVAVGVGEPPELIAQMKAGEHDLAVLIEMNPDDRPDDGIERIPLLDDPMYVVLPTRHRLAHLPEIPLQELAAEHWMFGSPLGSCPDTSIVLRACHMAGFEPQIALSSDDYSAIQGFIASGVGVALIPELGLATIRDDVIVKPMAGTPAARYIVAAAPLGGYRSPGTAAMLEILEEVSAARVAAREGLHLVAG
jgi:DNA-binding transcriptional LysR family regulator